MADSDFIEIEVECYSGFKANERPVAFIYQGVRREITKIVDRWYDGGVQSNRPAIDFFKIRDAEGNVYLLRYQSESDAWSIRPY